MPLLKPVDARPDLRRPSFYCLLCLPEIPIHASHTATAIYTARESNGLHNFAVRHETAWGRMLDCFKSTHARPSSGETAALVRFAGMELGAFLP
jgi:hypothetical protein